MEKYVRKFKEAKEYLYKNMSEREAMKIATTMLNLIKKIVDNYSYVDIDASSDEYGTSFSMMYGNELIYNIDYKTTIKNLKNNNNFKIKDEKDEDYFFSLIER